MMFMTYRIFFFLNIKLVEMCFRLKVTISCDNGQNKNSLRSHSLLTAKTNLAGNEFLFLCVLIKLLLSVEEVKGERQTTAHREEKQAAI